MPDLAGASPTRIVGLADSDSYVKWGAALLGALPPEHDARLLVVQTRGTVSDAQQSAAVHGSGLPGDRVSRVDYAQLAARLQLLRPDAVLIAARGPVVRVLARLLSDLEPRPVMIAGLPGISIPATSRGLIHRTQCDLFVLHSRREIREFESLAARRGLTQRFALARLPFLAKAGEPTGPGGTDLVFASQALVPAERADRMQVARMLVEAARADPTRRVILKERGVKGEAQTHREKTSLPGLVRRLGPVPDNLVVSTAPMSTALDSAEGLVTVSSTAALEAIARGIPLITLDTFGVDDRLINPVFLGSGLFGSAEDVVARRYRMPTEHWLREGYFHAPNEDDWMRWVDELVAARRAGALPAKPGRRRAGGRVRDVWERKMALGVHDRSVSGWIVAAIGIPVRFVVRLWHAFRRVVLRRPVA